LSGAEMGALVWIELIMLTFPFCLFLFGINDYYDYESDMLNPRKRKKFLGTFAHKKELSFLKKSLVISVIPLIIISILTLNLWNMLAMFLLILFSYAYSAPPIRLKEIPILESVSNAIIIYLAVMLGFSFNALPWELTYKAYYVLLFVMAYHIFSTIMDFEADKKAGHKTFTVRFGKRKAALTALIVGFAAYFFGQIQTTLIRMLMLFAVLNFAFTFVYPKFARICFHVTAVSGLVAGILYFII
jgi:4-hydroxybenzoate polyprenyltransferase